MTPRELIEWGPVRCRSAATNRVVYEGTVTAATDTQVQVHAGPDDSRWFDAAMCDPVGLSPAVYNGGTDG